MRQYTILVDMDDTLENLSEVWVYELNKRHGLSVKPSDITEWDMKKFYPTLTPDEIYAPLHDRRLWDAIRPLPGAQEAVKRLQSDGHDVVVVTSAHPDTIKLKYDWLEWFFPNIKYNDIVCCTRKQLVWGDFLVDDGPHNLFGGVYTPIMFTANHNKNWEPKNLGEYRCYRSDTWDDVVELIEFLANSKERK